METVLSLSYFSLRITSASPVSLCLNHFIDNAMRANQLTLHACLYKKMLEVSVDWLCVVASCYSAWLVFCLEYSCFIAVAVFMTTGCLDSVNFIPL